MQTLFKNLKPSDVWGIGRKMHRKLLDLGIDNVQKLSKLSAYMLPKSFNVEVERTIKELNGIACKDWDITRADKLQIFSTRSVGQRITSIDELHQALATHAQLQPSKRENSNHCAAL